MRKLLTGSALAALAALTAPPARADVQSTPQCKDLPARPGDAGDMKAGHQSRDCFDGDVFILDGGPWDCPVGCGSPCDPTKPDGGNSDCSADKTGTGNLACIAATGKCGEPVVRCASGHTDPVTKMCTEWIINELGGVQKAAKITGRFFPETDEVVVWGADYPADQNMVFSRFNNLNPVDGIGLNVLNNTSDYKFTATISAGATNLVDNEINEAYACPSGACNVPAGFANLMDSLAQTSASMYVPYIKYQATGSTAASSDLTHTGVGTSRVWNSFLNMPGDLMGGNYWRDDGNGTVETAYPPPVRGVIPPFEGQSGLTFGALDLYLMGFMRADDVTDQMTLYDFSTAMFVNPPPDAKGNAPAGVGTGMGLVPGIQIRPNVKQIKTLTLKDNILAVANQHARDPGFDSAPHFMRQIWMMVTIPGQTPDDSYMKKGSTTPVEGGIIKLRRWRRTFNWYFYMLTHWRGRMITTFEGNVDDSPYFEFGLPEDDLKQIEPAGGLSFADTPIRDKESPAVGNGVLVVNTPGAGGKINFLGGAVQPGGGPMDLRIDPAEFNVALVRMRIPADAGIAKGQAHATVSFDDGPTVKLPASDAAFLIPDGLWHTYSASLTGDSWTKHAPFSTFSVEPSDKAGHDIEIDFVRIAHAKESGDTDIKCGSTTELQPDGWVDDYDNCPGLYNPGQEDGNGDGVGDACEDFDGDGIPNLCDNCPTLTNSRQRDRNHNGLGDVCDPDQSSGCFLTPSTLGGAVRPQPGLLLSSLGLLLGALVVSRRRR